MVWRKWIVRGIVYGIVAAAAAGALAYEHWTNPGAVREQIITELEKAFPGAEVSVDSARLRILGGIQLNGLRFSRKDDPEKHEFLQVPSAIFYHDKEKILDGELRLRKIELIRPRLRASRGRDGKWNLAGLGRSPGMPDKMLPAIVIHQGTFILEDRSVPDKTTVLEINDVSLTLINDPLLTLTIRGAANSDLLGKLQLAGMANRETFETHLSFRAAQIPLTQDLAARLPIQCPPDIFRGLQLSATAHVEGKLSLHPDQPPFYEVRGEVLGAKLQHPKLPLAFEDLNVKFHCNNGELQLEKLTARSGKTEIEAHGMAQLPCVEQEFEVQLDLKHVVLGRDLAERLPEKIRNLHDQFQPRGPTTIHIACARHEGEWVALTDGSPSQVSLRPEGVALTFKNFAYPLERATGAIDYNLHDARVQVDLTAYAGACPVFFRGHWTGKDADADVKFDFHANDLTIEDKLLHALPTQPVNLQTFVAAFHATGKVDVKAHIRREPGKDFRNEYHLYFHDTAVKWDPFPYALEKVSGFINIYPEHWEFKQFQGMHRDGQVIVHGKSIPKVDAKGEKSFGISLEITGRNIELDDALREALRPMPGLYNAWETFNPQGNICFTASVNRPSADMHDLDVHVDARGASVKPKFLQYLIQDITGQFRFHHHQLQITSLRAKHNQAIFALDRGTVDIDTRGGYYADLADLRIGGFQIDSEFVHALPKGKLQDAAAALKLKDPVRIATRLVVAQPPETGKAPEIYWDGKAWMYDARFTTGLAFSNATGEVACVGRVNGTQVVGIDGNLLLEQATLFKQPLKKLHAKFQMRDPNPDVLLVGLRAPMFGGDVVGQMEVDLNSALRYEVNLTASQINLAEFGRHNLGPKSQIHGAANARLHLTGMGTGVDSVQTLDGNGAIDVPRGHLYNLPFLLDLLKFLGLHWPDRTAFEEFHTAFGIQGSKVTMQKVDLLGSAVSLSGKGEYDLLSKNLQVDVYPLWGRIEGLLPPLVRPLPTTLSKSLVTVEVRGKATGEPKDLKYQMKPVPVIVDPLLLLRDRMFGAGEQDSQGAVGEPHPPIVPPPPTVRGVGRSPN